MIVYDIQDMGVRFYTYESTLGYFLEAAAKSGKPIFVLDRPDPIGGVYVQGPIADAGREVFVSYWQNPRASRHDRRRARRACSTPSAPLARNSAVVQMEGWMRGDWFDSTGSVWINPSPNMRSLTEADALPRHWHD